MKCVFLFTALLVSAVQGRSVESGTCLGRCGSDTDTSEPCQCNDQCVSEGNCCKDYNKLCVVGTCEGRCGDPYDKTYPCNCNRLCAPHDNCCDDFRPLCGLLPGEITDEMLWNITGTLHALDSNRLPDEAIVTDFTSDKLLKYVDESYLDGPTFTSFIKLLDNYIPHTGIAEPECPVCRQEEQDFLDKVLDTPLMKTLYEFMHERSLTGDSMEKFKAELYQYWFRMYTRSKGPLDSSGFEHVFVGEIKGNKVGGFHNWIQYYYQQEEGEIVYQQKLTTCEPKPGVVASRMTWMGYSKSIQSMILRNSPEMDLALYTLCYRARPSLPCYVNSGGERFSVTTYSMSSIDFRAIGTAYPDCIV